MKELKFFSSAVYNKKLNFGSPSKLVSDRRNKVYGAVMDNFQRVREQALKLGLFSNTSIDMQGGQLGVTLREAALNAYLDSFAGYIAYELPMTQKRELIILRDKVTKGGDIVMPAIGKQSPRKFAQRTETSVIQASADLEVEFGCGVIPGSVEIKFVDKDKKSYQFVDDRKENILGPAGILVKGDIKYDTGKLTLNIKDELIDTKANLVITYAKDNYVADTERRIKARERYFEIQAEVNKLEYEYDVISAAINSKTLNSDLAAEMYQAVKDEHKMALNDSLVNCLVANYSGGTTVIDLSAFTVASGQVDTITRVFHNGMTVTNKEIGKNCYKAVGARAYLVGTGVGALLEAMDESNYWVPNNSGFINGLIGFYKEIPVLQHADLQEFEGYALYKDENIAPIALGIMLPDTDLPLVSNFNAVNEVAGGLYSIEGVAPITSDLVRRFELKMPSDWMNAIN